MSTSHQYNISITWTGNSGSGTSSYRAYSRNHIISIEGKQEISASSDKNFRGDADRHNPEELLVASVSSCHMLWYLHLCAVSKVVVLEYRDNATGIMIESSDGSGRFQEIILNPDIVVEHSSMLEKAKELHELANKMCFIANSLNFPVHHNPTMRAKEK